MTATDTRTETLAREFSARLSLELGDETMNEIARRNARTNYTKSCASHDFCDSNMVMLAAFADVFGLDEDTACDRLLGEDLDLVNDAWDEAVYAEFYRAA